MLPALLYVRSPFDTEYRLLGETTHHTIRPVIRHPFELLRPEASAWTTVSECIGKCLRRTLTAAKTALAIAESSIEPE